MTAFEYSDNDNDDLELTTNDNKFINLNIEDLLFFSKFPDCTLWTIYRDGGFKDLKLFVKNYLSKITFDAIVSFYDFEKWPHSINIPGISDPYVFLNLPPPSIHDTDDDNEYSDY